MCNFKSWFFDDNGYVVQCETCKHYQVSFGTTMLNLNKHNFMVFCNSVFDAKAKQSIDNSSNLKCVVLPTPCNSVNCVLTNLELNHLYLILEDTDNEIKSQELLQLFANVE